MTKKAAAIIAMVAFVALVLPCGHLVSLFYVLWEMAFGTENPVFALWTYLFTHVGQFAGILAQVISGLFLPAALALLLYRYLSRRTFQQVCDDCAAHKARAWLLFAAFLVFTLFSPGSLIRHFSADLPAQWDATGQIEPLRPDDAAYLTVTLEMSLCHPDNDRLVKELSEKGPLTDEALSAAPQLPGYRLMRMKGDEDIVRYVSNEVALSREDVQSAKARNSPWMDPDEYEVEVSLTREGREKFAELTKANCPHGTNNQTGNGRMLAIVVNGELVAAPIILAPITDGQFIISAAFTREEAASLSLALSVHIDAE